MWGKGADEFSGRLTRGYVNAAGALAQKLCLRIATGCHLWCTGDKAMTALGSRWNAADH